MAEAKAKLIIDGDASGAENAAESVSSKTIALGNLMSDLAKGALSMALSGLQALGGELIKSANAASESQKSQVMLASAMQQAGVYTKEAFKANVEYATSLQKNTIYEDEEVMALQKLYTSYGISNEAQKELIKSTMDLAAATGRDLATAGEMVAKSVGGGRNALKQFGVSLSETGDASSRAEEAVAGLTRMFGGQSQAAASTFDGKMKGLKNSMSDLYEEVGGVIVNNKGLKEILDIVRSAIEDATKWVENHKIMLAELVKGGIVFVIQALKFMVLAVQFVSETWTDLGNVFLKVFKWAIDGATSFVNALSYIYPPAKGWVKSLNEMKTATEEEIAAGTKASEKRSEIFDGIVNGIQTVSDKISTIPVAYEAVDEVIDQNIAKMGTQVVVAGETTQALIDLARGYTEAELVEYESRKNNLEMLLQTGEASYEMYYSFLESQGKKFNDKDLAMLNARKAATDKFYSDIFAVSNATYQQILSGQKSFGTAIEDAWKASARAILDAEIDKAIKQLGIVEALEVGKATMGGFLSFGMTLLAIPLIAAASAAAKAIIHGIVGFAGGGMVGPGGSKMPFPSFASTGAGAPALVMAHEGEAIGTPSTLAAAGVGGITVNFNNYGPIGSDADVENIGTMIADKIKNSLRGQM